MTEPRTIGRRTLLASALASLAAPAFVRSARGQDARITLKLHHALSSVSCAHANFLVPWARTIEAQSGGRIRIDIFPSMQLGGQPADLFDQAHYGAADLVWAMPSKTPGRFPRIETFELPFVPSRRALVSSKAVADFAADHLHDEFRDLHSICFSCADRGILHARRRIESLGDMKGLRLDVRTRFAGEAVQALGARALPVPSAQLPLAITRGVVDGGVIPWDMVSALKLHELLKAHTDFADYALSTTTFVLAMNKAAYEKLPAELKKVIDDNSGSLAAGMAGAMWDLRAQAVADMVMARSDSVLTLGSEVVAHWRKATEPVIGAWSVRMKERKIDGEKLLASARALCEKYANEPEPQPLQPLRSPQAEADGQAGPKTDPAPAGAAKPSVPAGSSAVAKPVAPAAPPAPLSKSAPPSPPKTLDIPL